MVVLVLSIGLHEFGHAKFADLAGDDTPRLQGRVTLNPLKHLDPIGTLFMAISTAAGYGLGWGKPVLTRPDRMKNPRWDSMVTALAGPAMNLLLAFVFALLVRLTDQSPVVPVIAKEFLFIGVIVNVGLMIFNLIPLGPLDGHWVVGALLPEPARTKWFQFNRGIGSFLFLLLILIPSGQFDILGRVMGPVSRRISLVLLGHA